MGVKGKILFRTYPNVRGKPPTAKERHQRRAIAENRMTAVSNFDAVEKVSLVKRA